LKLTEENNSKQTKFSFLVVIEFNKREGSALFHYICCYLLNLNANQKCIEYFLGENPSDAASQWNVGSGRPLGRRLGANPAHDDYATAHASANATTSATATTPFEPTTTAATTSGHATVTAASVTPPISTSPTTTTTTATTVEPQPETATTSSSNWGFFKFSFEPAH
jgi:hypothetical protein